MLDCNERKLLNLVTEPWDTTVSPLFYRIQSTADLSPMLPVLLSEMEKNSEYAFLRENESFQELVNEYKAKLK